MAGWEEVEPEDITSPEPSPPQGGSENPFGVDAVDGIVYGHDDYSPDVAAARAIQNLQPPPRREAPQRRPSRPVEPWKPGPDPDPATFARKAPRPNALKAVLLGLTPIAVIVAIVWMVFRLYGFSA